MLNSKRMQKALLLALVMLTAWLLPLFGLAGDPLEVQAASVDYPVQLMNLATKDNSKVLTENGTKDGSTLSVKALGSTRAFMALRPCRFGRKRNIFQDLQCRVGTCSHSTELQCCGRGKCYRLRQRVCQVAALVRCSRK